MYYSTENDLLISFTCRNLTVKMTTALTYVNGLPKIDCVACLYKSFLDNHGFIPSDGEEIFFVIVK